MTVKILITRTIPRDKSSEMLNFFKEMRSLATNQPGYISGETLSSMDRPDEYLVISTWRTREDWDRWLASEERTKIQDKVDEMLGSKTSYEVFHHSF